MQAVAFDQREHFVLGGAQHITQHTVLEQECGMRVGECGLGAPALDKAVQDPGNEGITGAYSIHNCMQTMWPRAAGPRAAMC
jgi:hypothetical protein